MASQAEQDKVGHYAELAANYIVMPVSNETIGPWGPAGLKFIQDIGQRITDHTGEKRSTSFLFQSIGIATQRGNVASIKGSAPNTRKLHEIFYL